MLILCYLPAGQDCNVANARSVLRYPTPTQEARGPNNVIVSNAGHYVNDILRVLYNTL